MVNGVTLMKMEFIINHPPVSRLPIVLALMIHVQATVLSLKTHFGENV